MERKKSELPKTKEMLDIRTLDKIIDIILVQFPLGSEQSQEIIESYYREGGEASVKAIDLIQHAIEDEIPSLNFKDIEDHEQTIIPLYAKKLGLDIEELRGMIRKV